MSDSHRDSGWDNRKGLDPDSHTDSGSGIRTDSDLDSRKGTVPEDNRKGFVPDNHSDIRLDTRKDFAAVRRSAEWFAECGDANARSATRDRNSASSDRPASHCP